MFSFFAKQKETRARRDIYPTWTPTILWPDDVAVAVVVVVGSRITWKPENSKHSLSLCFISQ